jgi:lipopolysaccharide export LptBFGC system permease protein LptF
MNKKKKQEAILFGTVISGILIASSLLSISSQLIQEVRAQSMTNQPRTNATANQTDMDNATRITIPPLSPSCCPSNGYIANAGPDKTVLEGTIITLNGSSNSNSSNVGNTANYLWRQTDGPAVILNDNNTAHPTFVAPNYPNDTKYTFALEVSENQVINNNQTGSAIDTVDIVVKDANIEAKNPRSLQEEGNADG